MPNVGHRWTEQEERDAVEYQWRTFRLYYPFISQDAYRLRRATLLRQRAQAVGTTEPRRTGLRRLIHRVACGD